jgi:hypothetical protein
VGAHDEESLKLLSSDSRLPDPLFCPEAESKWLSPVTVVTIVCAVDAADAALLGASFKAMERDFGFSP